MNSAVGDLAKALGETVAALATDPSNKDLEFARGSTLLAWGRFAEARASLMRSASLGLEDKDLFRQLGWSCYHTGKLDEADHWMRRAVAVAPKWGRAHVGLGSVLLAKGDSKGADEAFRTALDLDPADFDTLNAYGVSRLNTGDPFAAEALFRRAIESDEWRPGAWTNLGAALSAMPADRVNEAIRAFERAAALEQTTGEYVESEVNLGAALQSVGRHEDAIELYQRTLIERPSVTAHANYAHSLLATGNWDRGWEHYEFRWFRQPLLGMRPRFDRPPWNGQSLDGKTLLLRIEQGFGDAIQFIRFAPMLKALGARVLLRVGPGFADLARRFEGVDEVLDERAPTPSFDYYIHLLSLPRVLGITPEHSSANIPYISVDEGRAAKWKSRVVPRADDLRVGIVWAGSAAHRGDRFRSIQLRDFGPLAQVPGVSLYSLQKGPPAVEATQGIVPLTDLGPQLEDFSDTAAAIAELDLVVSVDTSVAHLAGALGKPVWVLLPAASDWRWLRKRSDTPWYPSMQLFRQTAWGDWSAVIAQVAEALAKFKNLSRAAGPSSVQVAGAAISSKERAATTAYGDGLSAVGESRHGIMQYLPHQPDVGASLRWYGEYLETELRVLSGIVDPNAVMMEVSAGVGAHAVFFGSNLVGEGHLFVYERRTLLRNILRQNLAANGVTRVTVMKGWLVGEDRATERGDIKGTQNDSEQAGGGETIDQLHLERLDWLKINRDASPLDILRGAEQTLWRLRPRLYVSSKSGEDFGALVDYAKTCGYRCWRVETGFFNAGNFNRRNDDIFNGRRAVAMLAIPEEQPFDAKIDAVEV